MVTVASNCPRSDMVTEWRGETRMTELRRPSACIGTAAPCSQRPADDTLLPTRNQVRTFRRIATNQVFLVKETPLTKVRWNKVHLRSVALEPSAHIIRCELSYRGFNNMIVVWTTVASRFEHIEWSGSDRYGPYDDGAINDMRLRQLQDG